MSVIEDKALAAARIATGQSADNTTEGVSAVEVVTLLPQIIAVIKAVVALWASCKQTPAGVATTLQNPRPRHKVQLRWAVRTHVPPEQWSQAMSALLEVGKTVTEADAAAMLAEGGAP